MKIEHLKIFLEVAQSESINKAAGKLFTSHQNLNVLLKKLEEELCTTLFVRSNKGISLSEDGKELMLAAEKIVTIYDEFQAKLNKESGIINFYTSTSLAGLVNDLQGCMYCNNYISVHKKNVDELYAMMESKKKGIYFIAVNGDDFKKLQQHKNHIVIASDNTAVQVFHKDNPALQDNASEKQKTKIISNLSQNQMLDDFLNIDDTAICKKMMREGNFAFTTSESLYRAFFPEDEWVCVPEQDNYCNVHFTLFSNVPNNAEWNEACKKIAAKIKSNFNIEQKEVCCK